MIRPEAACADAVNPYNCFYVDGNEALNNRN